MTWSMHESPEPGTSRREVRRIALFDSLLAAAIAATSIGPFLLYPRVFVVIDDVAGPLESQGESASRWWAVVVAAVIVASLVVRRILPRTSFVSVLALTIASSVPAVVALTGGASIYVFGTNLPMLVSVFTLTNVVGRRAAVPVGLVGAAGVVVAALMPYATNDGGAMFLWVDVVSTVLYAVVPVVLVVVVAQVLREQRLRADAAQRETSMAMVSAELRAASAASAERRRLASELHDIVAHHVNLMVVQSEKGPYVRDLDGASWTFATIAQTGRAALGELDRLLGVLRTDGDGSVGATRTAPLPTIEDVPSLVDAANRAGVGVVLREFAVPAIVDPAVSATVHRIVQECITNVVKHAERSEPAVVSVVTEGAGIIVRVVNRSAGERVGARRGHGIGSMRSRLDAFGGSLVVDDRDGWFHVEAIVPVDEPVTAAADRTVTA